MRGISVGENDAQTNTAASNTPAIFGRARIVRRSPPFTRSGWSIPGTAFPIVAVMTSRLFPFRRRFSSQSIVFLALMALAGTAMACGSDSSSGMPTTTEDLVGKTFVSTGVDGESFVAESELRITFEEGNMSAIAGCNTLFGGFTLENGNLSAPVLASTQMACADELMRQDEWITELLSGSPSVTLSDGELTIASDSSTVTLVENTASDG